MWHYIIVGLGGAAGAVARVGLSRILPVAVCSLPFQIIFINVLGCFVMGILTGVMTFYWYPSLQMKAFLTQGFLGGFTTFSAFSLEVGLLYERGQCGSAIMYAVLSCVLTIALFFAGLKLARLGWN